MNALMFPAATAGTAAPENPASPFTQAPSADPYHALYTRFERALALLCECMPYVDEEDYVDEIDSLLAEACAHYPLRSVARGPYRELARRPAGVRAGDEAVDATMDEEGEARVAGAPAR